MVSMRKICFWLGVFAVALLVMVQPARAEGVVNPVVVQGWCLNSTECVGNYFATAAEACASAGWTSVDASNQCLWNGGYYGSWVVLVNQSTSCPANSTGIATCVCDAGYQPDASATACVASASVCPAANTVATSGLFDIGTNPDRVVPGILHGCGANNCGTAVGSLDPISRRGIIGGQEHFYSVGVIVFTGEFCVAGNPSVPSPTSPNIQQSCGPGQSAVTGANNFFRCYKDGASTGSGSSSVPVTTTQTTTGTTTTTDPSTGASSVTTSTTVSETTITGGGTGAAAGTPADPLADYCATTPTAEVCKQSQPAGTVSTPAVDGLYNGDLNAAGHKTVSDVVGSFKTRVLASPVGSSVGGFFNVSVSSGACPVWSADVPMFGVMTFDAYCVSWFQNMLPWIKSVIMIIFCVAAFRIAIL